MEDKAPETCTFIVIPCKFSGCLTGPYISMRQLLKAVGKLCGNILRETSPQYLPKIRVEMRGKFPKHLNLLIQHRMTLKHHWDILHSCNPSYVPVWHYNLEREMLGKFLCGNILRDSEGKGGEISS